MLQPWCPALVAACGKGAGGICSRGPNWGSPPLPGVHTEETGSGFAVSEKQLLGGGAWQADTALPAVGVWEQAEHFQGLVKGKDSGRAARTWPLGAPCLLTRDPVLSHAPCAPLTPFQAKLLEIILSWKSLQEMVGNGGFQCL